MVEACFLVASCLMLSAKSVRAVEVAPKSSATYERALGDVEAMMANMPDAMLFRLVGASMGDFMGDQSLILVEKAELKDIREGMIVVYRASSGDCIAHRVIKNRGSWLVTAGVENLQYDPEPVTEAMLTGAVFAIVHTAGLPDEPVMSSGKPVAVALCKDWL